LFDDIVGQRNVKKEIALGSVKRPKEVLGVQMSGEVTSDVDMSLDLSDVKDSVNNIRKDLYLHSQRRRLS